ncbi:tyrosine-type recombinase/integrase [Chitinophaga oryziterrae]|uniref:Tyrosine-type recombinase/integrase n=1 Tax=Chitinophaga oryziterrae TaxID=1031224 RepID=A0A6N8JDJ1_9BACT|nr:site-specific integrase [Chitinophaga oryziterrae]MVT42426.1 tyrosine-type recombinase/integrase [Chitinophaga oryziterrae]
MATVKIVLRKKLSKDGTLPLCLRITKDRKTSFIHLGYAVKIEDWDEGKQRVKKSHANSARLNNLLLKKLAEATDGALEIESKKTHVSAKAVRNKIKPSTGATFFPQADDFLNGLKQGGKYNQYTADKPRIGHFRDFLKGEDIAFSDITVGLLEKFKVYLKSCHTLPRKTKTSTDQRKRPSIAKPKKPMGERTIMNHLVVIRSVFAHARKNHVITKDQSPFGEDGIKIKFPDTKKVGVSPEDVECIENTELPNPTHDHARKLWLFSFYFAGMRVSDVLRLRWSDFQNYRLHYSMGKNDKGGSLKIPDKAVAILKHYEQFKGNGDDLIFPELRGIDLADEFNTQRTIAFKTSALDKILRNHVAPAAEITSKLTMHISRHTFAGMAGDTIPIQMLQKLYRHSKVETTIGYQQNFIHQAADDALDAVINKKTKPREQPEPE